MPIEQVARECTRIIDLDQIGPGGVWIIDPSGKHLGTIAPGGGEAGHQPGVGWGRLEDFIYHHLS
jgi:hypothetical protein